MSEPDQTTQDLQAAYDYLEEHGWCQGVFVKSDGKVCLDGALCRAMGYLNFNSSNELEFSGPKSFQERHRNAILRIMLTLISEGFERNLWAWNDASERTVEDVKLILKKAINNV